MADWRRRASSFRPQSVRLPQRDAFVVHGIAFDDLETAVLARKVISITSAMSLIALAVAIMSLITGWYWGSFLWAGLALPLCGFCGTLNRSRFTVACFSTCSLAMALLYIIAIVSTTAVVGDWVACACDPQCRVDAFIPLGDAAKVCSAPGTFRTLFWVSTALSVVMVGLMCAGGVLGFQLAARPHFEDEPVAVLQPPPVVYYVQQQPPQHHVVVEGRGYAPPPPHHAVYSPHPMPAAYRAYASPQAAAGGGGPAPPMYTYAAPGPAAAPAPPTAAPASPTKRAP